MPTLWEKGEGHNQHSTLARSVGIPRGQRPQACTEATCARTGRSCVHPLLNQLEWNASRSLRTYDDDERTQEVGQTRSSDEADRKSTRLNSSHLVISYAVFCLKKKKNY